jgi:two-component system sensor histidine kinase BaeS
MARLAERHDVDLHLGPTASLVVLGDAARLEQVVVILLDNAITCNRPGGLVDVTLRRAGGQALLDVRDTGRGIPAAELPHLFARFHRGWGAGVSAEGSGLGLAIAHAIVCAHRGRLHVRSEPGVGSCFSVLLPLAPNPGRDRYTGTCARHARISAANRTKQRRTGLARPGRPGGRR